MEQVQEERDVMRGLLAQQQTSPSQVIIHNHNYNQILNLTINNNVVLNVGTEDLKHIDKRLPSLEMVLNLPQQSPESLIKWCKMVRCDINNPQNHNVLLTDPAATKAWQFNGNWSEGDTNQLLTNMVGRDAQRLSGCINDADDLYSRPDLRSYKFDYLNHTILARCAQADYVGLAPILDPLKQMLSELTRTLYITEREEDETSNQDQSMQIQLLEMQLARAKLLKEKKDLENLIDPTVQGDEESRQNLLYLLHHQALANDTMLCVVRHAKLVFILLPEELLTVSPRQAETFETQVFNARCLLLPLPNCDQTRQ